MSERLTRVARGERQAGFTLIELLVVIVIIGVLLAVAVPSYLNFRSRGQEAASQASVRSAVPALEAYFADNGSYAGMDMAELQALDPTIQVTLVGTPNASSYCIRSANTPYWYKQGPTGVISTTACTGP
jgi:prepilin-type N-terminal cleavage/methylation domain-containing protein